MSTTGNEDIASPPTCCLRAYTSVPPTPPHARTHNGILGAASALVTLLIKHFPHSIDALEKDTGHFDGPLPTLLTDTSKDDLSLLLCGSDPKESQIEFGAHQAVLVRTQEAKSKLPSELRSALVLTIFEAKASLSRRPSQTHIPVPSNGIRATRHSLPECLIKILSQSSKLLISPCAQGLEFDDVFIFNFFADSPADEKTWNVVTDHWQQSSGSQADASHGEEENTLLTPPRPVTFDPKKHALLNDELKMLYTAITRACVPLNVSPRKSPTHAWSWTPQGFSVVPSPQSHCVHRTGARVKVVLYDEDAKKRLSVFHFLLTTGLAQVFDSRHASRRGLAVSSTSAEWVSQGSNIMRFKLYALAARCFQKGDDAARMSLALGCDRYTQASMEQDSRARCELLVHAARCFERAGHTKKAALCLKSAGEHTLAAQAYRKLGRPLAAAKLLGQAAEGMGINAKRGRGSRPNHERVATQGAHS